ncbi:hypothetical protein [Wolbachia endosymbiont of Cimex lectularius]|uniref:hypothetical protein n=1 Tax=Wolbachia endosymbiont of Cimex lectularius TaxID=246273 RepID=UPI000A43F68F|nr:hypothetical protein [Wolbachia endosymbiont of Cimex lectularius]
MFVRSFIEDEGRSFEIGFQEQVSTHLKWLYLRDRVMSVKEKSAYKLEGVDQKDERE